MTYHDLVKMILAGFAAFATEEDLAPTEERVERTVEIAKKVADMIVAAGSLDPEDLERLVAAMKAAKGEAEAKGAVPNMPRAKA